MLSLRSISVFQFKNYQSSRFSFDQRVIGICGPNGTGKTNLVDAIYSLCFTKSYFSRSDQQNVKHGEQGFRVEGEFDLNGRPVKVASVLRETGKKEFSTDGQVYERISKHIGMLPAVIIAPDDADLITGGSEERRRYLDTLFSQLDPLYLQELMAWNRVTAQRNVYLKSCTDRRSVNHALLDTYDLQLAKHGSFVYRKRQEFILTLLPFVARFYSEIAGKDEEVSATYESQLHNSTFEQLLSDNREKDIMLQRTSCGIHKDDLALSLGGRPFKTEASQGQRKSLLFALKLAEFEILKQHKGFAPILLLDDVFEKLDETRIRNLLT
ncbi:MAG: DNA replication and repair protein RecF, partial [Chitinophagaceae bacterium]